MSNKLLDLDAIGLSEKIHHGVTSSVVVVQTFIDHIKIHDNPINAVVEERFQEALKEAISADEKLKMNEGTAHGPLFGVPISVKESFHVKGMKTTGGLVHRKDHHAKDDADVIKKLKEAGAIVICKTNTPTLCFCQETDNKLFGRTNNPWDLTRTAGGSSGGEGALLAIGGAAAGIGSDIGGSIRFPSHFNGVLGFKPGKFQVSSVGHFPPDIIPLQARMSGVGPMGKSVRDIALMYNIIAKERVNVHDIKNMTIQFLPESQPYPLSQDTNRNLSKIKSFLQTSFQVEQEMPPHFTDSAQLWQEIMSINGGENIKELAFKNEKGNIITTYAKELLTRKTNIHTNLSWALIGSSLFKPSKNRKVEIEKIITNGDESLHEHFCNRLLIMPTYHSSALKHGKVYKEIFSIRKTFKKYMPYVAYSNVWGLPTLTIPVGVDKNNLPIGIQIISTNGNEGAIFALGKIIESKFRGYVRKTE